MGNTSNRASKGLDKHSTAKEVVDFYSHTGGGIDTTGTSSGTGTGTRTSPVPSPLAAKVAVITGGLCLLLFSYTAIS